MDKQQHMDKHIILHTMLDELVADYILHQKRLLSETTVLELIRWSYKQTISPEELNG